MPITEAIPFDFPAGEARAKGMTTPALLYTLKDLDEVIRVQEASVRAGHDCPKLGYYYDERHVVSAEYNRRMKSNAKRVAEMAKNGDELPEGTMITSTAFGVPTGGCHEVRLLDANKISQVFSDPRPFWCYGWEDLHHRLILP